MRTGRRGIIVYVHRGPECLSLRRHVFPQPTSPTYECVSPWTQGGGELYSRGGKTQFRRLDRKPSTRSVGVPVMVICQFGTGTSSVFYFYCLTPPPPHPPPPPSYLVVNLHPEIHCRHRYGSRTAAFPYPYLVPVLIDPDTYPGGPKTFGSGSATLPPSYQTTYGTYIVLTANLRRVQGGGAQSEEDPTEDPEQGVRAGQPETETGIPGQHGGQGQGLHRREPGAQGESEILKLRSGNGNLDPDRNCVPN
jgi:hypothetical protein